MDNMLTFVNEKVQDIPFLKTLGVSVRDIAEKHAEMTVTIDDRHLNYMGTVHGGLISALVDTVCFFPKPLIPSGLKLTTVDLNVSYVRPALKGDTLVARSEASAPGPSYRAFVSKGYRPGSWPCCIWDCDPYGSELTCSVISACFF